MLGFILQPQVLGVLALVVVFAIGLWGRKWLNNFRVIFQVWHLTEKMGILAELEGYEKLALAMGVFQDKFYDEFGKKPKAGDKGWAVKVLTWLCKLEDKEDVEDFLEPLPENTVTEA